MKKYALSLEKVRDNLKKKISKLEASCKRRHKIDREHYYCSECIPIMQKHRNYLAGFEHALEMIKDDAEHAKSVGGKDE